MAVFALLKSLLGDTRGATAVEYGLILVMIVIAIFAALGDVANEINVMWSSVEEKVTAPN